jgi:hypothetical protein
MTVIEHSDQLRVRTAEAMAESLTSAGIRFVVINGLYGYPSGIGRDVDLLIRQEDVPRVIACAKAVQTSLGWDSLLVRWSPFDTWQLFFLRKDAVRLSWLEVDPMLKDTMVLGAASLLGEFGRTSELVVDYYRGPFPVSKLGQYVKSQLRPILYGDVARFKRKYALEAVEDNEIVLYLRSLLGISMSNRFCEATKAGVEGVSELGKELKWKVNSRFALRHPLRAIRNTMWSRIVRPLKLYFFTAGMVLQVTGPDIVNKAEILEQAESYLNGCFEVRIKQRWIGVGRKGDEPGGERGGWLSHWLRIARQCASVTWRYYAQDRFLPKSVIQFVLYGDGVTNVAMNPGKYGFRSTAGLWLVHRLVPRAIEIVLLPESSEQMIAPPGNGERGASIEELSRWRSWVSTSGARNVVMAGESPAESGQRLAFAILQEMDARFGGSQCKKLRRAKRGYGVAEKAVP